MPALLIVIIVVVVAIILSKCDVDGSVIVAILKLIVSVLGGLAVAAITSFTGPLAPVLGIASAIAIFKRMRE